MKVFSARRQYVIAFWTTLLLAICLIVGGACTPPYAEIDGSILEASGLLFLWPALAFGNKALEEGKTAKIKRGNTTIQIGDVDDVGFQEEDFDEDYEG